MSEAYVLPIATAQLIRDYMEWHVENGRGSLPVMLDRRGLGYLQDQHEPGIGIPPVEETYSEDGRVYLRAVF